jgi:hypothetical protein
MFREVLIPVGSGGGARRKEPGFFLAGEKNSGDRSLPNKQKLRVVLQEEID